MKSRNSLILMIMAIISVPNIAHADQIQGPTCEFPDLSGMTPVPLTSGASSPDGMGGDIPGGRWELITARYDDSAVPVPIAGEALSALELEATGATTGNGSLALEVTITSPVSEMVTENGAGPYSVTGTVLDFQNDCGGETSLGNAEYSVDTSGPDPVMTLWGDIDAAVTIPVEVEFRLVEPTAVDDPVFADRFES